MIGIMKNRKGFKFILIEIPRILGWFICAVKDSREEDAGKRRERVSLREFITREMIWIVIQTIVMQTTR